MDYCFTHTHHTLLLLSLKLGETALANSCI
jgi:hypothetical protein